MRFGLENPSAELELPKDSEVSSLVVIVKADEPHKGRIAFIRRRDDILNQPLSMPNLDNVSLVRRVSRSLIRNEERFRWRSLHAAACLKETRSELGPCAPRIIETVQAARCFELIAPERAE